MGLFFESKNAFFQSKNGFTTNKLTGEIFSLYYTSYCMNKQTIDIIIRDNFKQEHKPAFSFEKDKNDPFSLLIKVPF